MSVNRFNCPFRSHCHGGLRRRNSLLGILVLGLLTLTPSAQVNQPDASELLKLAEETLADVSRLRELPVKSPITKGISTRQQIKAYLLERIEEEYPAEELSIEQKALAKLGLIPPELDLLQALLQLLIEQVAGFYDPKTGRLYVADWVPAKMQRPVLAHELTHALQDQHFGLKKFLKRIPGNDDASLARNSLIEGEGLAIMMDVVLEPFGQNFLMIPDIVQTNRAQLQATSEQYRAFREAPRYLREILMFPYTHGANFLQYFRKRHSWREVSRLYSDLPQSSEQVLHPEKYLDDRDDPSPLSGPPLLELPGLWKSIYQNVLGEFVLSLLLQEFLDETTAAQGSRGWDGDSIVLMESRGGKLALVLRSVWDSEQDAQEFFTAYRQLLERKYPDTDFSPSGDRQTEAKLQGVSRNHRISAIRQGRRVEIIEAERALHIQPSR